MRRTLIKYLFYFILFACLSCNDKEFDHVNNHTTIQKFLELGKDSSIAIKSRISFNDTAWTLINKNSYDTVQRVELYLLSKNYFYLHRKSSFRDVSRALYNKALKVNDTSGITISFRNLALYHENSFAMDSAYYYYCKVLKLNLDRTMVDEISKNYLDIARLQYTIGDYANSEKNVFNAIRYFKRSRNSNAKMYVAYGLLAIIYCELREYDKSLEYHRKSIAYIDTSKKSALEYGVVFNNMGNVYLYQRQFKNANTYFLTALETANLIEKDLVLYAMIMDNLAYTKLMLGQNERVGNMLFKAYKIRDSLNIAPGIILSQIHLSEYYALKNNIDSSIYYANQSFRNSKKNNLAQEELLALKQLMAVNPNKATEYGFEYIHINDSLQRADRKIRNKFARIAFETEEIQDEKNEAVKSQWIIFLASLITISLITLLFIVKSQRAKTKKLKFSQQQHDANSQIYQLINDAQTMEDQGRYYEKQRIAKELHDGVMNQLASTRLNLFILTKKQDEETINKCLYFINNIENIEKEISNVANDLVSEKISSYMSYNKLLEKLFAELQTITKSKIKYEIDHAIDWQYTSAVIKMNIYRILQESLQNAIKYAKAKNIVINVKRNSSTIRITIEDDGVGFSLKKAAQGIGIKNMEERIKSLSGTIEISSQKGVGTTIIVNLPQTNQTPDHGHNHPNFNC